MYLASLKNFIIKELAGWKKTELLFLNSILLIVLVNAIYMKDSLIAFFSAIFGILYTAFAGKGKISCYLFGLGGSGLYAYLSLKNALYGNLLLYLCYYIPMQILGIFRWRKHLNSSNEIYKKSVNNKKLFYSLSIMSCVIVCIILGYMNDSHPIYDGITTAFSVVGMYLTVRRCIEQWVVWGIVNSLSAIMWLKVLLSGQKVYSTVLMWTAYFIFSIYFYFQWKKEFKTEKKPDKPACLCVCI